MPKVNRPIYELHLRPEPGINATSALRGLLKVALRRFGMKCVSCEEVSRSNGDTPRRTIPADQKMR